MILAYHPVYKDAARRLAQAQIDPKLIALQATKVSFRGPVCDEAGFAVGFEDIYDSRRLYRFVLNGELPAQFTCLKGSAA